MSEKTASPIWLARLFPMAVALAWLADYFFWGHPDGISFPIFIALALGLGFWLARQTDATAHRRALWLLAPIAFFALMSILRAELMTVLLSRVLTLFFMALLAASFLGGRWPEYGLGDLIDKLVTFVPKGLGRYRAARDEQESQQAGWRQAAPILRGLLLAAPLLLIMGSLLASADPFFGEWLDDVFSFLDIDNLAEYLLRAALILILANLLLGAYYYAFHASQDDKLLGENKPILTPFLGFTESATILGSLNLLFAAFVIFQFQYLFGGERNISFSGYTYAEYARRGFDEMAFVALLALLLFVLLSQVANREGPSQRKIYSWLGAGMFALVAVILVSAFQRLLLYESAYGYSQIRIYSHVFMIWLGLLLAAVVVLEMRGNQRAFGLAMLGAVVGFSATLGLINVDSFIVHANLERARQGYSLTSSYSSYRYDGVDFDYLVELSTDALPALADEFERAATDGDHALQALSAAALICHAARHDGYANFTHWRSWQFSESSAASIWENIHTNEAFSDLDYRIQSYSDNRGRVHIDGVEFNCGRIATTWP